MEEINLISLKVIREKSIGYTFNPILKPEDIFKMVKGLIGDADREYFLVINVDVKNKPTSIEITSIGTLTEANIHPREIFKNAYLLSASFIICIHNHPSGDPTPSIEDIEITKRLKKIGEVHAIYLQDHLIIGKNKYYSFYEFIKRLNWGRRQFNVEEDWSPMNDYETTRMIVTSTSYNPNVEFNEYVHWGAALYDLIDILNMLAKFIYLCSVCC